MSKISVIVPVYNTEKYLHRCIDSILAQTFTDFELLLIDDGSKDNSGAICDEYAAKDSRVRVFHKENGGVSSARNMGLDNAQGEWITFVDSDDVLYESALSVLYTNKQDAEIITASIEDENRVWSQQILGTLTPQEYELGIIEGSVYGYPVATLYHRSVLKQPRTIIPSDIPIGEDVLFKLDLAKYIKKAVNIEDVIYWYRSNDLSVMHRKIRSVQYYKRYFELRDSISKMKSSRSIENDLTSLLDAFFHPYIPYRESDYYYICKVVNELQHENFAFSEINKNRIKKLFHKNSLVFKKTISFCKNRFIALLQRKPMFIILD